jgi:hypothetical protein
VLQGVCEVGCEEPRAMVGDFLFWLRFQAPAGTSVQTIGQVVGGCPFFCVGGLGLVR